MRYTHFEIKNYKGIEKVRVDLTRAPRFRINTLVGLNESGKTTVLEAINRWFYREKLDALSLPGYAEPDLHDLIPISKRANFTDTISIEAGVALDDADQQAIAAALKSECGIDVCAPIEPFNIVQSYKFASSKYSNEYSNIWALQVLARRGRAKPRLLRGDDWKQAMGIIKNHLPRIVYFPNFLFDFPDRIYLEGPPEDPPRHTFYKAVLQDVLDAIGQKTNLDEHVLARAKSTSEYDKKALESVLLSLGSHITQVVFNSWNKIFKRSSAGKEVVVTADKDGRGMWYLQLRLKDGSEYYEIGERSLGFRWFFVYLLLTQYRGFRREGPKDVVFLFDEPASNLHPSAQRQLLDSFANLPERCTVIYTTHSHHLVNPEWLDGTFVVKNEGLVYGSDDDYSSRRTLVTVTRYREFVVSHPNQTTYFQPVLDVLDYRPSDLELVPNVVMLEGKNDFYALSYMAKILGPSTYARFLPGSGAGSLDAVIQLYLGWGRDFIIVLDSDTTGATQKKRYVDKFGPILDERIFTLSDLEPSWSGKSMESLFSSDDRLQLQMAVYADANEYKKAHFNRALQELLSTKRHLPTSSETRSNFSLLLASMLAKLRLDAVSL